MLPREVDVKNWAVVACDQYTSDRSYWDKLAGSLTDPTTLNLIFPECYLSEDNAPRIQSIIAKQNEYIESGIFRTLTGTVLVERKTAYGNVRHGLMCLVNLNDYCADGTQKALIRATEGLVESRIPPRVAIRKNCPMELPHIMVLIDDEKRTVIEPLIGSGEVVYDGEMNGGGGHITGYNISDTTSVENALDDLLAGSVKRYGEELLFLVGDGNHSLATAKACRDENNPLSHYALVEIVNIHDEGLKFEPIYRALFGIDKQKFLSGLMEKTKDCNGKTTVIIGETETEIPFPSDAIEGVKVLQDYVDAFVKENGGEVDYIHGINDLKAIVKNNDALGVTVAPIDKNTFFKYVVKNGKLPRKTFSMGEADEKRYYMEARRVK